MKLPTDLVKMYKEIHGWVGIISGLALFIAFYAGAITMFEEPLQRWASPPSRLAPPPSLERTPELIDKVLAAHPEAAKDYEISLAVDSARPARMSWTDASGDEHGGGTTHYASLAPDGSMALDLALALARPAAFEYVLVHELCHLMQANHSPAFWAEVEARFPQWRAERDYLRTEGRRLKATLRQLLQAA